MSLPSPSRLALPMAAIVAAMGILLIGEAGFIHAKALLAQVLLERAFAATLAGAPPQKPWPWADMTATARLEVPRLGASAVVLGGASGEALAFGPALLAGTGHTTAIAGHRDTHFFFIGRLAVGDAVRLERADGSAETYRVTRFAIADSRRGGLAVSDDAHELVLVTCYPLDGSTRGPLRYLVYAEAEASADRASRLIRSAMEARPFER